MSLGRGGRGANPTVASPVTHRVRRRAPIRAASWKAQLLWGRFAGTLSWTICPEHASVRALMLLWKISTVQGNEGFSGQSGIIACGQDMLQLSNQTAIQTFSSAVKLESDMGRICVVMCADLCNVSASFRGMKDALLSKSPPL